MQIISSLFLAGPVEVSVNVDKILWGPFLYATTKVNLGTDLKWPQAHQ